MIKITEAASNYIISQMDFSKFDSVVIEVIKGGCSGMQYKFSFAHLDDSFLGDEVIKLEKYNLIIKNTAVLFVIGTILDHEKSLTGSQLVFKNPNEKHRCGCGKSFNV
jgi:iron-sulfur cluster assembly accessory protein